MADPDLERFIRRKCTDHDVEYDALDDNIRGLVDSLAVDALAAKRREGVPAPHEESGARLANIVKDSM